MSSSYLRVAARRPGFENALYISRVSPLGFVDFLAQRSRPKRLKMGCRLPICANGAVRVVAEIKYWGPNAIPNPGSASTISPQARAAKLLDNPDLYHAL